MRILIIRFSSIGDIIATTALPRVIRQKLPEARIDYLTSLEFRELISYNKNINKVYVFNRKYARFTDLVSLAKFIRQARYDIIIDAHNTLRTRVIKYYNPDSIFIRYDKHRFKRFLLNNFKINLLKNIKPNIERHANALANFGIKYDAKGTEIYIPKHIEIEVQKIIDPMKNDFVVLIPGAAWKNKRWDKSNFRELAYKILKLGYYVVVLGLDRDRVFFDKHKGIYDFTGKFNLIESIAVIKHSKLVVGNDTGLVHAGEAVGKDVLMIQGPTSREYGMSPYRKNSMLVGLDMWCRPCSSYGSRPCIRLTTPCIRNITVSMVFDKLKHYLELHAKAKSV